MSKEAGIWIEPTGGYIDASISHIDAVIKNPILFQVTRKDIEDKYRQYGEKFFIEGKAREEVIKEILKYGFIRVRKYSKGYTINVQRLDTHAKKLITNWASDLAYTEKGVLGYREQDLFLTVSIVPMEGQVVTDTLKRIALGSLSGEVYEFRKIFKHSVRYLTNTIKRVLGR